MIEAKGIEKAYGRLQVLRGVDLSVAQGEMVSIVGSSGAGKTTLLQILGTLDAPDHGSVAYQGVDLFSKKESELAAFRNQQIGFVFQFHHLLPEFNALENIFLPGLIAGGSKAALEERARELLEYFKIGDRADHLAGELSGGEQQRVAVARALMNRPQLLLADEPSGNLDSKNASEMHQLFKDLQRDMGQTIVLITHNQELADLADRALRMQDGLLITS
ncbi:MAG: Lipoprotein-releasing system ATP-binding protein LolD [Flavobacteriia bacterium]|nr:MAG: Lipoprotein-releasing system ATP-binding protein LolD [Flavobacteriia bacterium]